MSHTSSTCSHRPSSTIAAYSKTSNTTPHITTSYFINAPTITTSPSPDHEWRNYSLRNFLTVDPKEDANVLYARTAIKAGRVYPGFVPPLPGSLSNVPVNDPPALQTRALVDETHYSPNPKCNNTTSLQPQPQQAPNNPRFQTPGASPMRSNIQGEHVSASTDAIRLLEEDLGFCLEKFLATNPDGDANALYGRIALNNRRNTPEDHRLLAHQGNEGDARVIFPNRLPLCDKNTNTSLQIWLDLRGNSEA